MNRLILTANLGLLKVYRVTMDELSDPSPSIRLERVFDPPDKHSRFEERDTDKAGRFSMGSRHSAPGGSGGGFTSGMGHGERHNEKLETEKSQLALIVDTINEILSRESGREFYLAAPEPIHNRFLEGLSGEARGRLLEHIPADLNKVPRMELLRRFQLTEK